MKSLREAARSPMARYKLEYLLTDVVHGYFRRWSAILRDKPREIATERASRLIAGHLLGLGFSPDKLHGWATWLQKGKQPETIADLFEEADALTQLQECEWPVFVPFRALRRYEQTMPSEWLEPEQASRWLAEHVEGARVRHNGGFVFTVGALDPWTAVEEVSDVIESLGNRIAVGVIGVPRFEPLTDAYVAGYDRCFPLKRPRQVEILSLKRSNALLTLRDPRLDRLRSAIDLVALLEMGTPQAAIAGGWAALEAILARPDAPNVEVARDLALLVACSFARAELTPLSYAYEREHDDQLASDLNQAQSNQERCRLLSEAIRRRDYTLVFTDPSDHAAAGRMRALILEPRAVLGRVQEYVEEALSRLYRQRNLVLHVGKTDSVALPVALRTVPPLVGAGLDRLVHDALTTERSDPLRLVARAAVELELCGQPGGLDVLDLLGN